MNKKDANLLLEISQNISCYIQQREGWYVLSCFEQELGVSHCCEHCKLLTKLRKRLEQ